MPTATIDPVLAQWYEGLPSTQQQAFLADIARKAAEVINTPEAPNHWQDWLLALFPNLFKVNFAQRHIEFWEHVESIEQGVKPLPFFAVWSRGGAKTTSAEAAVVRLGARGVRKFCLYVRSTQDKANESVLNISAMLESKAVERHYSDLANRKLGKYGNSKGWRVDTLRCASGFSVVGLGLDAAVRGIKIEEFRPDLIILDDIDHKQDSPETITKKIDTLTTSILPAGSADVAIIGIQNLMHSRSIFNKIVDGSADFLYDRKISGPYPAIEGLEYEQRPHPERGYRITGGIPTWEGQDLKTCEHQINEWGLTAFLQEAQHDVRETPGGIFSHLTYQHCQWAEVPQLLRIEVWVDPAVTATDKSDSMGIQADGLAVDTVDSNGKKVSGRIYRLYSWEQVTSPDDAIRRAILKAIELKQHFKLGSVAVGVETDQGGDTWKSVYELAWKKLIEENKVPKVKLDDGTEANETMPVFKSAKAGEGHGSKLHRGQQQLSEYERGRFIHVIGTHEVLEKAQYRFGASKPYDLVDAGYWSWQGVSGRSSSGVLIPGKDF